MDLNKEETIVLTDDDGQEHEFNLEDVLTVEGEEYAILKPASEDEAIILKFGVDEDGNEILLDIEDDEEWERVADAWQEILEEDDKE